MGREKGLGGRGRGGGGKDQDTCKVDRGQQRTLLVLVGVWGGRVKLNTGGVKKGSTMDTEGKLAPEREL